MNYSESKIRPQDFRDLLNEKNGSEEKNANQATKVIVTLLNYWSNK